MGIFYTPKSREREGRVLVAVDQYRQYHRNGFLVMDGLLSADEVAELYGLAEETRLGVKRTAPSTNGEAGAATQEAATGAEETTDDRFKVDVATRVHMLSRLKPAAERGLLNPRVLDVLEALIGPDVYAVQTMLFLNPPGKGGQGWHQDSYYIKTHPDSLIGVWIALEDVDEDNGCLWVVPGSNHEPVYPTEDQGGGNVHALDAFSDLQTVANISYVDDEVNTLSKVVYANYPPPIPVPMKAGQVLFFHSHLFHRSYPNRTTDRFRRSFVCHYCNARSWVPWDHDGYEGESGNYRQILARGRTHNPYAEPAFGTEVYLSEGDEHADTRLMGMDNGMMMPVAEMKD